MRYVAILPGTAHEGTDLPAGIDIPEEVAKSDEQIRGHFAGHVADVESYDIRRETRGDVVHVTSERRPATPGEEGARPGETGRLTRDAIRSTRRVRTTHAPRPEAQENALSKFVTFEEVCFKSRELLLKALAELGYPETKIEEGEALHLNGYRGDRRGETAEIVIRREHLTSASNDLGFRRTDAGYVVVISEYDTRALRRGRFVTDLSVAYNHCVVEAVKTRVRGSSQTRTLGRTRVTS
jgi:hypothetical protein